MSKFIVANWKSHKNIQGIKNWLTQFQTELASLPTSAQVIVLPPFPLLTMMKTQLQQNQPHLELGVQDLSPFPAGAYTGAVTGYNLQDLTVKYALVGHSERRRYFQENHQQIANKVAQAVAAEFIPIVCVDEPYLAPQAKAIEKKFYSKCIIAYEPIKAIGSGKNQAVNKVKQVVAKIQRFFGQVPVIYGGSVKPANAAEYLLVSDGVLVGGASLDGKKFARIVKKVEQD
ncbi:MAG: hypothetical protein GF390_01235 [Candidatus Pacebacteria bacterium]|nr:hypothetical protein [Candidatus Paceibacterota bacterium]